MFRHKKAREALERVGLKDHMNKRPNQLSGGQMQRVAIARALVNDPDILLADEPTGALDSKTSVQIMDLLKEVAKDRLVIMVTHNRELAETYSTRIIELKDGEVIGDTNPYDGVESNDESDIKVKKTNMSFKTALSLSLNNLMTKKGRTILTAFAGSIGIIGIALILSLSNGVQEYIDRVQEEALSAYPISIESSSIDLTSMMNEGNELFGSSEERAEDGTIISNNMIGDTMSIMSSTLHANNLEMFKKYLDDNNDDLDQYISSISYEYNLDLQLYKDDTEEVVRVNPNTVLETLGMDETSSNYIMGSVFSELFENDELNDKLYDVVTGRMPEAYNEVVLLVDDNYRISDYVLYALGIKDQAELEEMYDQLENGEETTSEITSYDYDELVGLKFKLLLNTDYYEKEKGVWVDKSDDEEYLREILEDAEEIEIVGIIKPDENSTVTTNSLGGIMYLDSLEKHVIDEINDSEIVSEQKENPEINVITGLEFSDEEFSVDSLGNAQKQYLASLSPEELANVIAEYQDQASLTYDSVLEKLGAIDTDKPSAIYIYSKDFESKDAIKDVIADYNQDKMDSGNEEDVINYSDLVGMLMSSVTGIIDMISYVLIAFVSISLVVSSIMIGIITYISVLERTKEIGILRAIGASKKDVSRVFNAETLIVGLCAGVLGILVTVLLNIPINIIIENLAGVSNLSALPIVGALILILISVGLTMIAGLIPSRMASKKDPVEALRSE